MKDGYVVKIKALNDFGYRDEITKYEWTKDKMYEAVKRESSVLIYDDNYNCHEIYIWDYYDCITKGYFEEVD